MAKRKLADLYVRGKLLTFDDGDGDSVEVYLRKLTPVEAELALKKANAARARVLTTRNFPDSDDYKAIEHDLLEMSGDEVVDYLVMQEMSSRPRVIEAELGEEEEWSTDGYLEGLVTAWDDQVAQMYATDPTDPEAKRVHDELDRFSGIVNERLEGDREAFRKDFATWSEERVRAKAFEKALLTQANVAWLNEFRKCEVWLASKDPSARRKPYFQSRSDLDELPSEVLSALMQGYDAVKIDLIEGKASRAPDSSSPSSELSATEATADSSGPVAVEA